MSKNIVRQSKFLSLVLRHKPEEIGITLDSAGWVAVDELLAACGRHGFPLTREELDQVVRTSDKKRFAMDESGTRIRANQGHSVPVELGLAPVRPPDVLYHGTVDRFLAAIRKEGLKKGQRHHVHLSADEQTAVKVGERRGEAVILKVDAAKMHATGYLFYQSENGVWLTDRVPPEFIQ